jgi:elongation factor Ts
MADVSASLVKELRAKTGAGMMDCKQALAASNGDLDAAVDWLRKKGLATAAKKAGRIAADGLIGMAIRGNAGVLVEVNAETDFVARSERFQALVRGIADVALEAGGDLAAIGKARLKDGSIVNEAITAAIAAIGENIGLRRAERLSVDQGVIAGYVHNQIAPGLGRLGVLVALRSAGESAPLADFGKKLAMHVAATNPLALTVKDLGAEIVERERAVLAEQAKTSGKAPEIVDKMVEGRLRRFYQDVVLSEQIFVIDGETPIKKAVEQAAAKAASPIVIAGFRRLALGEGIAKPRLDLAEEVAKLAG